MVNKGAIEDNGQQYVQSDPIADGPITLLQAEFSTA